MHYYLSVIQYDGTGQAGFQWQKDAATVQQAFNSALAALLIGKFSTRGASRTDSGVHALHQVIKITCEEPIECSSFLPRLNHELAPTIRALSLMPCPGDFNPAVDAHSKEYRYLFTNLQGSAAAPTKYIANIANPLRIEPMQNCIAELIGRHDFKNFFSAGSNVKSSEREITLCELTSINPHSLFSGTPLFTLPPELTHCYQLRIEANGFLKQMIRHLMAALWMVGSEKLTEADFKELLVGEKKTKRLWKVAPARGLYLFKINYQAQK